MALLGGLTGRYDPSTVVDAVADHCGEVGAVKANARGDDVTLRVARHVGNVKVVPQSSRRRQAVGHSRQKRPNATIRCCKAKHGIKKTKERGCVCVCVCVCVRVCG